MTREEAQERLQKAEQEIKEVKQYLKTHPERDIIRVPRNIQIEKSSGEGDRLGIRFTDHVLNWVENTWNIDTRFDGEYKYDLIPCELILVKRKDFKIGYKYHFTDDIETSIAFLNYYGIYDGDDFICIEDDFPQRDTMRWSQYYQVVPIKEQS